MAFQRWEAQVGPLQKPSNYPPQCSFSPAIQNRHLNKYNFNVAKTTLVDRLGQSRAGARLLVNFHFRRQLKLIFILRIASSNGFLENIKHASSPFDQFRICLLLPPPLSQISRPQHSVKGLSLTSVSQAAFVIQKFLSHMTRRYTYIQNMNVESANID